MAVPTRAEYLVMDARQRIIFEHELDTRDFATLINTLNSAGFNEGSAARQLATIGRNIVELDAEEFEQDASRKVLPISISDQLRLCAWPNRMPYQADTPLDDLIPTYELLLELLNVQIGRRDWTAVLSILHLMNEYFPLLAAQSTWGHAGRPKELLDQLEVTCLATSGDRNCKLSGHQLKFAQSLQEPTTNVALHEYLHQKHSLVGSLILTCSTLVTKGSVNPDLDRRLALAKKLQASELLALRHHSPVGHFFAVPDRTRIHQEWKAFVATVNRSTTASGFHLSQRFPEGVADLVTAVAGSPTRIKPSNILEPLAVEIRAQVEVANSQPE